MPFSASSLLRPLLLLVLLALGACHDSPPPATPPATPPAVVAAAPDYWPSAGWQSATPESQGFAPGALDTLAADAASALPYYTSLIVIRNGWIVHESYHDTSSETSGADATHHLWSVTKSVTSMTVGRAWTRGDLTDLDVTAASVFPASVINTLPPGDARRDITLRHALQMRSGLAWNETAWLVNFSAMRDPLLRGYLGYNPGCANDSYLLLCSILQEPLAYAPGTVWNYDTYDTYLVSAFFSGITGMPLSQYAAEQLFTPLGITFDPATDWTDPAEPVTFGGGTLHLRSRDLARLGMLMLYDGQWDGAQLISPDWITQSTTAQGSGHVALFDASGEPRAITAGDPAVDIPYALQWWRVTQPGAGGTPSLSALGLGGQMMHIDKDRELIILITCDSADLNADRYTPINDFLKTHILDKLAI